MFDETTVIRFVVNDCVESFYRLVGHQKNKHQYVPDEARLRPIIRICEKIREKFAEYHWDSMKKKINDYK